MQRAFFLYLVSLALTLYACQPNTSDTSANATTDTEAPAANTTENSPTTTMTRTDSTENAKVTITTTTGSVATSGQYLYTAGDELYIWAEPTLRVRIKPNVDAGVVASMPYGQKATVLNTYGFERKARIGGLEGHWIFVRYEGQSGYAFDAYLSKLPAPSFGYKDEYCFNPTKLIEKYAELHFQKQGTSAEKQYSKCKDCPDMHIATVQALKGGHRLIKHQYWEGQATELIIRNGRLSEAYQLTKALLSKCPGATPESNIFAEITAKQKSEENDKGQLYKIEDEYGDIFELTQDFQRKETSIKFRKTAEG